MSSDDAVIPSIIPHLLNNDFGVYLDEILQKIVLQQRDTIHQTIDDIIAIHQRRSGKGHVTSSGRKASSGNKASAPSYTMKDPKIQPTASQLKGECLVGKATRSLFEPLLERRDSYKKFGDLYKEAVAECTKAVNDIIKECQAAKKKFFDASFYFDKRSVMYPDGSPADCTVGEPKLAKRLTDLFPGCTLFQGGVSADDIMQGGVGDCFLIGAISAAAANDSNTILKLFAGYSVEWGVYGVVFYKDGAWEWVIVDDLIAVNQGRSGNLYPQYAAPCSPGEVWPCILEKAYAKLHYNWDAIDGGWAREAVVDITGGADYTLDLYRQDKNMSFKTFSQIVVDPATVVGCAVGDHVEESAEVGNAGESGAVFGLFKGHQYGVLDAKETSDGCGFVRCRNPWGNSEWSGPYSDGSKEWKQNPLHKKELGAVEADDGDFWMKWEDFKQYMTSVDVIQLFDDKAEVLTMYGTASDSVKSENTFLIQLQSKSPVSIIASQDDPKTKYDSNKHALQKSTPYGVVRFVVYKLSRMPKDIDDVSVAREKKIVSKEVRERNALQMSTLDAGLYAVTITIQPPSGCDTVGYLLRAVAPEATNLAMWRFAAPEKKLAVGPIVTGPTQQQQSQVAPVAPPPTIVSPIPAATTNIIASSVAPSAQLPSAPVVLPALTVAVGNTKELDTLRRDLEDANSYRRHLEGLYEKQCSQLDVVNKKFASAQQLLQQQQQQIDALQGQVKQLQAAGNSRTAFRDPATAGGVGPTTPWGMAGLTREEWGSLVSGTFDIAARGKRQVSGSEATNGVRCLVTGGLGLDEVIEAHPLIRREGGISVADFAKLAEDVVKGWGFQRISVPAGAPFVPNMNSEEL